MRLPSLYGFYKAYFGYITTGKVPFALAIRDTFSQIDESFQKKDEKVIIKYKDKQYPRQLTIGFLNNFMSLVNHHYTNPFKDLVYINNSINIPSENLNSKKRLDIDFGYCYDSKNRRLIFLEFGKLDEVPKQFPLFNTLATSFPTLSSLPLIERVACWDLSKGTTYEEMYTDIGFVSYDKVLSVAKKIVGA